MDVSKELGLPDFLSMDVVPIEPNYYGAAKLVANSLGMDKPPPSVVYWKHGWEHEDRVEITQFGDPDLNYRNHLVHTQDIEIFLQEAGFSHVKAVGMPFLYARHDPTTKRVPGSLLVMPPHTLLNAKTEMDETGYLDYIHAQAHHFSRVVFCISIACLANNFWQKNLDKYGFDYVIGAGLMDQNALLRMRKLLDSFEYMTTNTIGSHVLYAAFCGVKVSLAGPYFNPPIQMYEEQLSWMNAVQRKVRILRVEMSQYDFVHKKFPWFFTEPHQATTHIEWAQKEIGFDHKISFQELGHLLFERNPDDAPRYFEAVFRVDASNNPADFLAFVQGKALYDPALMIAATAQLLAKVRLRSAYILADVLTARNHQDPIISLALHIGSLFFNLDMHKSGTLEKLYDQVDAISQEQQENLYQEVIIPLLTSLLAAPIKEQNTARIQQLAALLKAVVPRFRTKQAWNLRVIDGAVYENLF